MDYIQKEAIRRAISYPYKRESQSYLYVNGKIIFVNDYFNPTSSTVFVDKEKKDLLKFLEENNLEYLDNKNSYLILAYGSNSSFEQLQRKFEKYNNIFIPVIKCKAYGIDVVYSADIAKYGSIPATIQGFPDTIANIFITIIKKDFIDILHKSESVGVKYNFVELENLFIEINKKIGFERIYSYLSIAGCLNFENSEIALKSISVKGRKIISMNQKEILYNAIKKFELVHIENNKVKIPYINKFILNCIQNEEFYKLNREKLTKNSIPYKNLCYKILS